MRLALVFEAERTGYSIDQIADRAITVGDLKGILEDYDDDDLFILSHDNGYTYGSISRYQMQEVDLDETDEEEDD